MRIYSPVKICLKHERARVKKSVRERDRERELKLCLYLSVCLGLNTWRYLNLCAMPAVFIKREAQDVRPLNVFH